jgi:ATP-binding cassette subfamily B protein
MSPTSPPTPAAALSNGALIRRLFGLAWRYRLHCLRVLGLQLALLTMGITGLSFTGLGIDYIRHQALGVPLAPNRLHLSLPADWPPLHLLGLLAGLILLLALCRAALNYTYAVSVNRLVQQKLVVDLRGEVYEKLQRLSFRFFDANNTGSIITRVTSDVQAVRMFVDQVLIQSVIMGVSLAIYVAYMASLHPGLTAACLATTPVLWILSAWFSRKVQPEMAHNRTLVERMVQLFAESIRQKMPCSASSTASSGA